MEKRFEVACQRVSQAILDRLIGTVQSVHKWSIDMSTNLRQGCFPGQCQKTEKIEAECIETLWTLERCIWLDKAMAQRTIPGGDRVALARRLFDGSLDDWLDRAMTIAIDDIKRQLQFQDDGPRSLAGRAGQIETMRRLLDELGTTDCDYI